MKKCEICGKPLSVYTYDFGRYVYKIGTTYFCSWTCYRSYKKSHEPEPLRMEWRENAKICGMQAKGEYGRYNIKHDNHGRFKAEYWDSGNIKRVVGHFDSLEEAEEACENDDDWEF